MDGGLEWSLLPSLLCQMEAVCWASLLSQVVKLCQQHSHHWMGCLIMAHEPQLSLRAPMGTMWQPLGVCRCFLA